MNDVDKSMESYRSLLLLAEIESDEALSQRELSRRLGIALGLVNSYLKNLVAKGFIRVKSFPRNRYGYLLTPQGMAEKSRLAYGHLSYFTNLYTVTRKDYRAIFQRLSAEGVVRVVFCGVDEVAEIAYLSLQETDLQLDAVLDTAEGEFFGYTVQAIEAAAVGAVHPATAVVITSLKRAGLLRDTLVAAGVPADRIHHVAPLYSQQEVE